jgi:DNA-binding transcriptional LysR family regulator
LDRFREIQGFVAVVDAGSFVGAADALGISKTAASRLVTDLEARLGARLLHRTTRRLSLTDAGRDYHERCKAILAELDEADASASSSSAAIPTGVLRINAPSSFGVLHLAPLWPEFAKRHPLLRLDVTLSDRLVDLVDEGYDMAVRITRMPASTLVSRLIARTELVACASPEFVARHGLALHPSELSALPAVAYSYLVGQDWQFEGPTGSFSVRVRPAMVANNGDTCRAAALAGLGIVLEPTFLVGEDLAAKRLLRLCPDWRSATLGVHAVYPTRRHLPSKVRLLVDFLAGAFETKQW